MKRLSLLAGVAVVLTLVPSLANGQGLIEFNLCNLAWFSDERKHEEYRKLTDKLSLSPAYRDAQAERTKASQELRLRMSDELFELWARMQSAMANSVRSHAAAEAQVVLTDRCLDRLRREPQQEIDVTRTDTKAIRSLLALPDPEFDKQFRARIKRFQDSLGTPEAADQTIRINLGLPVPH